jgi:glycosyltransferase involved in cell wall biosynthesis
MTGRTAPLTVVHVQKFAGIAGSEAHLRQLLTTFDRTRVVPILLMLGSGRDPRERAYIKALDAASVRVERLPLHFDFDPALIFRLRSWFRRERPDIVHTHLIHADIHAGIAARWAGVPVLVSTKHNDDRFRRAWPIRRAERLLSSWTDRTIAISDALRTFHVSMSGVDPSRVTTIHYGYAPGDDVSPSDPAGLRAELRLPPEAPIILTVGRLVDQKGHDVLLRALPLLAPGTTAAHVVIVGDGPRRPSLIRLAGDLGVAGRVRFLGWRDDVSRLMRAATVLAHPARWEGFGLVLLEAMAAHVPIVAAGVSAIPEIIESDVSGLLVPPDDPPALARALDAVLASEDLRHRLTAGGVQRLTERFGPAAMARSHEGVYEALVAETRGVR